MANLLDEFGVYIGEMNGRERQKGIVLLGPGKAKPLDARNQPLGAARDLVRSGSAERKALLKKWIAPCDTEQKLRASADGAWTRGLERTPGRDFDPRARQAQMRATVAGRVEPMLENAASVLAAAREREREGRMATARESAREAELEAELSAYRASLPDGKWSSPGASGQTEGER